MAEGMTVAEVLERAADLIEPEGKWTQGSYARNSLSFPVDAQASDATCFCIYGAIARTSGRLFPGGVTVILSRVLGYEPIVDFNDAPGRKQADVVAKLREAAALARERVA